VLHSTFQIANPYLVCLQTLSLSLQIRDRRAASSLGYRGMRTNTSSKRPYPNVIIIGEVQPKSQMTLLQKKDQATYNPARVDRTGKKMTPKDWQSIVTEYYHSTRIINNLPDPSKWIGKAHAGGSSCCGWIETETTCPWSNDVFRVKTIGYVLGEYTYQVGCGSAYYVLAYKARARSEEDIFTEITSRASKEPLEALWDSAPFMLRADARDALLRAYATLARASLHACTPARNRFFNRAADAMIVQAKISTLIVEENFRDLIPQGKRT